MLRKNWAFDLFRSDFVLIPLPHYFAYDAIILCNEGAFSFNVMKRNEDLCLMFLLLSLCDVVSTGFWTGLGFLLKQGTALVDRTKLLLPINASHVIQSLFHSYSLFCLTR